MKGKLLSIGLILLVLLGVGLLSYPTVSNWLSEHNSSRVIQEYDEEVAQMNAQQIEEEWQRAEQYNAALAGSSIKDPFAEDYEESLSADYASVLNLAGDGVIGYIDISDINVHLPIYHGVSEDVLQRGVGHMEQTGLPIGGEGNHSVLTGHSGLSSAKLFTDLAQVQLEDVFLLHVLDQTLAYQVDQILVIEPDQTEALRPVVGEDYVTLVTCTPYAINSHRLLVRGTRIPYVEDMEQVDVPTEINWQLVMIVAFVVIVIVGYFVYKYKGKRTGKNIS